MEKVIILIAVAVLVCLAFYLGMVYVYYKIEKGWRR